MTHETRLVPHEHCKTAYCNTVIEVRCTCGFVQGTGSTEYAEKVATGHYKNPDQCPVILD